MTNYLNSAILIKIVMFGLFRDIQRISGCKVDVDRSAIGSFQERKIVMRGTSKQVRYFLSDLCYLSFFFF